MSKYAAALMLALAPVAAGCGTAAIPGDEAPQPFEGKAVAIGADRSVLVAGVRGSPGQRGCEQSLAVARLDAQGRTAGRAGVSVDRSDSCLPQVKRVVSDRQGRLVVYGSSFDPAFEGGETGPSMLLRFDPSGRLDPELGDGGVFVDSELRLPFAPLPDGRLVDRYGTIVEGSETQERALAPQIGVRGFFPEEMAGLEEGLALAEDGIEVSRIDETAEPIPGYGVDGVASVLVDADEESVEGLVGLEDGALVVVSALSTPLRELTYRSLLRRVSPAGDPDGDFGERGRLDLASALGQDFFLGAVDALPDGRLAVIGAEHRTGRVVIARFTAAGRPDEAFGRRGVRRLDVGVGPLSANAEPEIDLAVAPDGSVTGLVGGSFRTPTRLLRLRPDGALDRRFGSGGVRRLDSL